MPYNTLQNRTPENASGKYYVLADCNNCGRCRKLAPSHFSEHAEGKYSYIQKQPTTPEEDQLCDQALETCPTRSIWADGDGYDWETIPAEVPVQLTPEGKWAASNATLMGSISVVCMLGFLVTLVIESRLPLFMVFAFSVGPIAARFLNPIRLRRINIFQVFLWAAMFISFVYEALSRLLYSDVPKTGLQHMQFLFIGLSMFSLAYLSRSRRKTAKT